MNKMELMLAGVITHACRCRNPTRGSRCHWAASCRHSLTLSTLSDWLLLGVHGWNEDVIVVCIDGADCMWSRVARKVLGSENIPGSTLQCPTYSCRNPVIPQEFQWNPLIPVEFQWNSQESTGIPLEFHWNKTGIKQTKVEILYLTLHILLIYRTTYFSLLSLLFLHLFKSVSQFLQSVYSSTSPSKFNFK